MNNERQINLDENNNESETKSNEKDNIFKLTEIKYQYKQPLVAKMPEPRKKNSNRD